MSDTPIDRARALLILRESVRCADAVSMCNQMADTIAELLDKFEMLQWRCDNLMKGINVLGERADAAEARLRELASAEPVAWMTDHKFVCGNGITKSPGIASDWKLEGWRVIELIRRPEMPS